MEEAIPKKRRIGPGNTVIFCQRNKIIIGKAFERWKELKELKIFNSDAEVAVFLLDR